MRIEEREYDPNLAVVFHKTGERWGELSNMAAGFPLVVVREEWLTAEALYQACRFPHLPTVQRLILEQNSPMAAKMRSKPFRSESRPDWDKARTLVMRWVLRLKLAQHFDRFSRVLFDTGELPIVERSHKDRFWGAVPDDHGILCGANVLGRLVMELRESVWHSSRETLLVVPPPRLKDFVVLGHPVKTIRAADLPVVRKRLF